MKSSELDEQNFMTQLRVFGVMILLLVVTSIHLAVAKNEISDDKIVGGRIAANIPFLVSIQSNNHHICGGSLLSLSMVLTACHCVGDYAATPGNSDVEVPAIDDPNKYRIIAGDPDLNRRTYKSQKRSVKEMFAHPSCVKVLGTIQWDFGVISTKKPFQQTQFVKPTRLYSVVKATFDERIKTFKGNRRFTCWVMGWGKAELSPDGASTSRYLKTAQMRIIKDEECRYYLSQQNPLYVNYSFGRRAQMCAVGLKWSESDCQGDSGGPVYCKGYLLGTVSYGFDCGRGDQPAVYTMLSEFVGWYSKLLKDSTVRGRAKQLKSWRWPAFLATAIFLRLVELLSCHQRAGPG